jgi:hypothetical protein
MKREIWKQEEIQYLIKNYPHMPSKQIAKHLGKNLSSIYNKSFVLNLKKTENFKHSEFSGCIKKGEKRGIASQFKKGQLPWNKNVYGYMGANCTSFKKGNKPANYKQIGSSRISKDGYLEIKVNEPNKWKSLHHVIWENAGNTIPKKMILIFIDGNKLNCTLENLALITQQENMKRNTIHRYPPEIKEAIHAVKKLNKTIKNYEKQD